MERDTTTATAKSGEPYRTTDLARAAGIHVNTVRLYEEWGFLAPALRAPNGYRLWTAEQLDQVVFARRALRGEWPGGDIRKSALALVRLAATGDLRAAVAAARDHRELVRKERARAEEAAAFLEAWARGEILGHFGGCSAQEGPATSLLRLGPTEAAAAVDATQDQVRNWERNRLIDTPRDETGRRWYGGFELGRLRVIRTLLLAGYSVMAILRMTTELDRGRTTGLREILDTPRPGEEVLTAFDRWLSALGGQEARAEEIIALLEDRLERRTARLS
jgi:DNA-binding transcriptional MerR regulator